MRGLRAKTTLRLLLSRHSRPPYKHTFQCYSRLIENKLGLRSAQRLSYGGRTGYCSVLTEVDAATVAAAEAEPSIFDLVEAWLERTPFLEVSSSGDSDAAASSSSASSSSSSSASASSSTAGAAEGAFSFWTHYRSAVEAMLAADEASLHSFTAISPAVLEAHSRDLAAQRAHFDSLLDPEKHAESVARGERRLSHRATQAALMITLFQHEPSLQLPYRLLSALLNTDEQLCAWRARHAQMVHRMLGAKLGTGGSSGYSYLKATVDRHRIFTDFFNLSTFLLPEAMIPPLPDALRARLGFAFSPTAPSRPVSASASAAAGRAQVAARAAVVAEGVGNGGGGSSGGGGVCPYLH